MKAGSEEKDDLYRNLVLTDAEMSSLRESVMDLYLMAVAGAFIMQQDSRYQFAGGEFKTLPSQTHPGTAREPCGHCGGEAGISSEGGSLRCWVECDICGMRGPIQESPVTASSAWNWLMERIHRAVQREAEDYRA